MKPKHIFWGVFLVTLGTLILISNFALVDLNLSQLWKLWPLVLIFWGISYIINKDFVKILLAVVIGILLALSIYGASQSIFNICDKDIEFEFSDGEFNSNSDTTVYIAKYDSKIKNVDFLIDAGAGSFKILEPTAELITIHAIGLKNNYVFNKTDSDNTANIEVRMKKTKIKLRKGSYKNKVETELNTNPIWNMNFDIGAAAIDFDLSPYKVNTLKLDIGAASLDLKIGDKHPQTFIDIDAGASSIDVQIPDSSGCEIKSDVAISSKHFYGFETVKAGLYRTENFESAKNKIYLTIDAGVSSINVNRYSREW
ncbi:MAG: hypothetical protein HXY50_11230 [Ignavibacteriaceae bacterium]|nr:hypothetical protein [Ignavibacteriaceae bacterium]